MSVRHLVGLVHIVVVQRAEEMLQTRHIVVIYGVDDGLHHKGVFLVLNRRETRLKTFNPLDDLNQESSDSVSDT